MIRAAGARIVVTCLAALRGQRGVVTTFLLSVLSVAGAAVLVGFDGVKSTQQYNQCQQIAADLAANPTSHSQAEVDNCARSLLTATSSIVEGGFQALESGDARVVERTGVGIRQLLVAVDDQEKIRSQPFIIKFSVTPAPPRAGVDVTVTVTVLNAATNAPVSAGVSVAYDLVSSDGFHPPPGTLLTNGAGTVQLFVEGADFPGITDTVTIKVGTVTQRFTYTYF